MTTASVLASNVTVTLEGKYWVVRVNDSLVGRYRTEAEALAVAAEL